MNARIAIGIPKIPCVGHLSIPRGVIMKLVSIVAVSLTIFLIPISAHAQMLGKPAPVAEPEELPRARLRGIEVGASLEFVRPFVRNNTAFSVTQGIGTPVTSTDVEDFNWNYQPAFQVWFATGSPCGIGLRAGYFHFDQGSRTSTQTLNPAAAATTTVNAPPGLSPNQGAPNFVFTSPGILLRQGIGEDNVTGQSAIRWQAVDLEGTLQQNWGPMQIQFSAGGRYFQHGHSILLELMNFTGADRENGRLEADQTFYGGGPTGSIAVRASTPDQRFGVYYSVRGSWLIGSYRRSATFQEATSGPALGNQHISSTSQSKAESALTGIDSELGFEWRPARMGGQVFFRGAVVNHQLLGANSASQREGNLSLFGASGTLGIDF